MRPSHDSSTESHPIEDRYLSARITVRVKARARVRAWARVRVGSSSHRTYELAHFTVTNLEACPPVQHSPVVEAEDVAWVWGQSEGRCECQVEGGCSSRR